MSEKKFSLGWWVGILTIVSMLSGFLGWGYSNFTTKLEGFATKNQVAIARNKINLETTDLHITLMYVKYNNKPVDTWSLEDQRKYKGLEQALTDLKREERELTGIPTGLPD